MKLWVPKSIQDDSARIDWTRVKDIALAASSIISACAIPLVGHWISTAMKRQEIELRKFEIAVDLLRDSTTKVTTPKLHQWASDQLGFSEGIQQELQDNPLPSSRSEILGTIRKHALSQVANAIELTAVLNELEEFSGREVINVGCHISEEDLAGGVNFAEYRSNLDADRLARIQVLTVPPSAKDSPDGFRSFIAPIASEQKILARSIVLLAGKRSEVVVLRGVENGN